MFAYINGKLVHKEQTLVVLETGNIGYEIRVSLPTSASLTIEQNYRLYTYLLIKEDSHTLYGFLEYEDKKLFILEDGIDGWKNNKDLKEEVQKGEESNKNKDNKDVFKSKIAEKNDLYRLEDMKKLVNNYKSANTHIIDVRDEEEWKGDSSSPYGKDYAPRKGRIPNAKFLLWTKLMENGNRNFKSNEEIEKLVKEVGIKDKNENIVVYCFKGARSSNSYVALKKAGYNNVKNYIGSWNEWSRYPELPIDDKKI